MTLVAVDARGEGQQLRYRLTTLGEVVLERVNPDGARERLLGQGKVLALTVYLAAARGRAIPREQLADLLWGDQSPDNAKGSLRQALYVLRQLVGEDNLTADRERVQLRFDAFDFDVAALERGARSATLDEIVSVYRGAFCATLDLGAADAAQRWFASERARLEDLFVEASARRLQELVKAGALPDVESGARALVAAAPENSQAVAAAFDALVACGEFDEARRVLGEHRAHLAATEAELPPAIAQRLAAQGRMAAEMPMEPRGSALSFGREMVGRDAELSVLLSTTEQVREGGARRVLVRGAGGIGKTRLLEEFEARVRLRGARVVRVRFLDGMQQVPLAGLADVVTALAELPGALGISEESASTLASHVPGVRSLYRGTRVEVAGTAPDLLRLREAISELLAVVTERRPLVLILDDAHLVDEVSRAVLAAARRAEQCRLVEVWAARPSLAIESSGTEAVLTLAALTSTEIEHLFTATAPLSDTRLRDVLVRRLAEAARGLPQLVLSAVRSAIAAGLLRVGRGGWEASDIGALDAQLLRAVSPSLALESLSGSAQRVLGVVALWNRPLTDRDLVGIAALLPAPVSAAEVRASLAELESGGLVRSMDVSWALAHDTVREAMQEQPDRYLPAVALDALIDYWCDRTRIGVDMLTALALLAGARSTWDAARRLQSRASHPGLRKQLGAPARELPALIAQAAGRPEWRAVLRRDLGFYASLGDTGRAVAGATVTVAVIALAWLLWMLQPRLVLVSDPIGRNGSFGVFSSWLAQPSAEIRNGFGKLLDLEVPVHARSSDVSLIGDTVVIAREGKAQFTDLASRIIKSVPDDAPVVLRLEGPWYVRPLRTRVHGVSRGFFDDHFRLTRIEIDGRDISDAREYVAGVNDTLRFTITYDFTTADGQAYYVVGAAPSWVDGVRDVVRVGHLPTPVRTAVQTAHFTIYPPGVPLDSGYVAILSGKEESVEYIFSATNWTAGLPVWGDGNDVMQLGPGVMERLRRTGEILVPNVLTAAMNGRPPDTRTALGKRPRQWGDSKFEALPFLGTAVKLRFR